MDAFSMVNKHLRVVSFNCKHVVSSIPEIRELCDKCDIIALQETWLQEYDLQQLSLIDNRFYAKGISAMDSSAGIMRWTSIWWISHIMEEVPRKIMQTNSV